MERKVESKVDEDMKFEITEKSDSTISQSKSKRVKPTKLLFCTIVFAAFLASFGYTGYVHAKLIESEKGHTAPAFTKEDILTILSDHYDNLTRIFEHNLPVHVNQSLQVMFSQLDQMRLEIQENKHDIQGIRSLLQEFIDFTNTSIHLLKVEQMELVTEIRRNISQLQNDIEDRHMTHADALANISTSLASLEGSLTQLETDSHENISKIETRLESFAQELRTQDSLEDSLNQAHQTIRELLGDITELDEGLARERELTNTDITQLRNEVTQLHNGAESFTSASWIASLVATLACVLSLSY